MQSPNNMFFMAYDGDNAGRMVGRAILANDTQALSDASDRINAGHDIVESWVQEHGGQRISAGGDEGTFTVPQSAIEDLERLRADYHFATQLTMTVGIGSSLSEAGRALMVGKIRGKNQVVSYDPSIDTEIAGTQEHMAQGTATEEEKKIGEAYLQPEQKSEDNDMDIDNDINLNEEHDHTDENCQYCTEAEGEGLDHEHSEQDCQYCAANEAAAAAPETHDCQYCREAEANQDSTADCEYCQEVDPEHDCQYCRESDAKQDPAAQSQVDLPPQGEQAIPGSQQAPITEQGLQVEDRQDDPNHVPAQASAPMDGVLDQISGDASNQNLRPEEVAAQIDDTDTAIGTQMVDGTSVVDNYDSNTPGDMGLSEEDDQANPDLSEVLQGGLDEHAQSIQKEKVVQMVSEALEGFKASKAILEKAKEQAPQLYQSSIAMIKAMIEMARMLGLNEEAQAQAEQDPQAAPGEQAPAEGQENEWHQPFKPHPDLAGKGQGGEQNQDPKPVRQ